MSIQLEALNPWIGAASSVMSTVLAEEPGKGQLAVLAQPHTACQVNVIVRVTGDFSGVVVFGMGLMTADRIASVMLLQQIKSFDQLAANALANLVQHISAQANAALAESGIRCEVTSPAIMRGSRVEIHDLALPAVVVPLITRLGEVFLAVGLRSNRQSLAA